jgi:predicted nicotinamide N-methyase
MASESAPVAPDVLRTTAGDFTLEEVQLTVDDRTWTILHTGAVISSDDELAFLRSEQTTRRPYGIVLWPAAIALAHELGGRDLAGKRVLELGAGTGLPGIVAAARGARVVQTDRQPVALRVSADNAARNGVTTIEHRAADWTAWTDRERYDLIIGSDILYAGEVHAPLRHIFDTNLAPGGSLLLSDPLRDTSLRLLEAMERDGWRVRMDKWTVGLAPPPRLVGVFALTR